MTADLTKKRRQRHVASDEAHAWARSLPLNNPNAKTVLRALALYVNGEGSCFVGLEQLAEDTDLSADTVRRRLVWLEQIGAIVRMAQWLDANGRRNSEGIGKRTSDEIRLLLQADVDDIERAARGEEIAETSENSSTETTAISPSSQQGLNPDTEPVSPRLAPRQPLQSCDHLTSEPEPESSPPTPLPGGSVDIEGWKEFESDWQEPILRQQLAQQVWLALKPEERLLARSAARGYVAHRKSQRKPPNVIGAHLFLRERAAWEGFAKRDPGGTRHGDGTYPRSSAEARALIAMHEACGADEGFRKIYVRAEGVSYLGTMTPQILAFNQMPHRERWVEIDHRQARAWENLFCEAVKLQVRRHFKAGDRAPWPWPPSTEGKIYTPEATPPPTQLGELSDQDAADFKC